MIATLPDNAPCTVEECGHACDWKPPHDVPTDHELPGYTVLGYWARDVSGYLGDGEGPCDCPHHNA